MIHEKDLKIDLSIVKDGLILLFSSFTSSHS